MLTASSMFRYKLQAAKELDLPPEEVTNWVPVNFVQSCSGHWCKHEHGKLKSYALEPFKVKWKTFYHDDCNLKVGVCPVCKSAHYYFIVKAG